MVPVVSARVLQAASHQQLQQPFSGAKQQRLSHPGGAASSSSSHKALGRGGVQHLASKAGMLQEQQLHARSAHHGMQISSAR